MEIRAIRSPAELDFIRQLFREYQAFLNVDLCFKNFEEELAALPGKYAPPQGELLAAIDKNGTMLGCAAVRTLEGDTCEMKRLYVRPDARGIGLGEQLARCIIDIACTQGYTHMQLETLNSLQQAMQLYEKLGFKRITPHTANPSFEIVYWELDLTRS
ncbi:GNAT family N-acetyltransferase [Thiofilum flexile]|uniref:GNAT family N-acetyltransferase n=1 Tax=Thiofilum flexile TaxID=125627 RepID=UPI000370B32B|nr:GNAT family N-acetyltransferase [Thiofilum flexile]